MRRSVATKIIDVKRVRHPAVLIRRDRVARLMRRLGDPQTFAAVLQHLGHERQVVQPPEFVKSRENLGFGSDFDPITGPQAQVVPKFQLLPLEVSRKKNSTLGRRDGTTHPSGRRLAGDMELWANLHVKDAVRHRVRAQRRRVRR
jgi:hypothetical protein